jgi:hypothetical protein
MLIGIGQMTHSITTRLTVWSAGYKITSIKPLENDEALKRGAEFLGESIVFLTAGGVIIWEYSSSKAKEKIKEDKRHEVLQQERDELQHKLHVLDVRLHALEKVVKANTQSILNFGERYIEPEEVKINISTPRKGATTVSEAASEKGKSGSGPESSTTVVEKSIGASEILAQAEEKDKYKDSELTETLRVSGLWGWITNIFRRG